MIILCSIHPKSNHSVLLPVQHKVVCVSHNLCDERRNTTLAVRWHSLFNKTTSPFLFCFLDWRLGEERREQLNFIPFSYELIVRQIIVRQDPVTKKHFYPLSLTMYQQALASGRGLERLRRATKPSVLYSEESVPQHFTSLLKCDTKSRVTGKLSLYNTSDNEY